MSRTDTNNAEEWTKKIFLYIYPPLYILGVIGNIIKYKVFSRPRFRHNFFNLFRYLSIINTFLLSYIIIDFMNYLFEMNLETVSYPFCKFVLFFIYSLGGSSGWILVLISIDRTICIFNLKNKLITIFLKSYNLITLLVVLFNLIYYIPLIVFKEYNINKEYDTNSTTIHTCDLNDPNSIVHWMDIFNSSLIPFTLMVFMTIFTLIKLNNIRSKTNLNLQKSIYSSNNNNNNFTNNNNNNKNLGLRSRDLKFAFTSIILNLTFLTLNLPIALYLLLSPYLNLVGSQTDDMLYVITSFFYYMNFGINFYINLIVNSLFKNELFVMIKGIFGKFK
jgi:hypothetical protein